MKITIGERGVEIRTATSTEVVCKECCFSYKGRSTRSCPKVVYDGKSTTLCTIYGDNTLEYFVDAEVIVTSKSKRNNK